MHKIKKIKENSIENKIYIVGLPKTTSQDRLRAFFERKTRGGPIYKLDITSQNRAVISFVDSKGTCISVNFLFLLDGQFLNKQV